MKCFVKVEKKDLEGLWLVVDVVEVGLNELIKRVLDGNSIIINTILLYR